MNIADVLPRTVAVRRIRRRARTADALSPAERRTLGGVLGFIAGFAALGPVAALGAAALGALAARIADPR